MASKATRDHIVVALETAGMSNRDKTKQFDVCRKNVFNQCIETTDSDCYYLQQAYSWSNAFDSYETNCANSYEASSAKSSQDYEENSKSARDFKITYAQDILNGARVTTYKKNIQKVTSSSFQAETT